MHSVDMKSPQLIKAGSLILEREVEEWQSEPNTNIDIDNGSGIIRSLFNGSTRFLQMILQQIRKNTGANAWYDSLERNAATLLFWGNDHGVPMGDLDNALQHSIFLRDTVILVFISIGELMSQSSSSSILVI